MAEGTYEYECERAELLGIEKPDYDEFMERQRAQKATEVQEEEVDIENLKVRSRDGRFSFILLRFRRRRSNRRL